MTVRCGGFFLSGLLQFVGPQDGPGGNFNGLLKAGGFAGGVIRTYLFSEPVETIIFCLPVPLVVLFGSFESSGTRNRALKLLRAATILISLYKFVSKKLRLGVEMTKVGFCSRETLGMGANLLVHFIN